MSDSKSSDHEALEFSELEPMESPELPSDAELHEAPELPAGVEPAGTPAGGATTAGGVQLRELDTAPRHLRVAALIAIAGSAFPWMGHGGGWITGAAAKVAVLLGISLLYLYWKYRAGEPVAAIFGKLAELPLIPKKKDDGKKKRKRNAGPDLTQVLRGAPFPTVLHLLALLVVVAALALPTIDPGMDGAGTDLGKAAAELGMLAWGAATWVHIYAFERGGKFNPIFPLMFLGHALAGILGALKAFGTGDIVPAVGALVVGLGGVFAAYTIIEALKQAKSAGDAKKAAAAEARRDARRSRKQA